MLRSSANHSVEVLLGNFAQLLARARALDAAAGSPSLVIKKLDEARGGPVTLTYSDVVDLEVLLRGIVDVLAESRGGWPWLGGRR